MFTFALKSEAAFTFSLSVPASPIVVLTLVMFTSAPEKTAFAVCVRIPSMLTFALKSDIAFTFRASAALKPIVITSTFAFKDAAVNILFEVDFNSVLVM